MYINIARSHVINTETQHVRVQTHWRVRGRNRVSSEVAIQQRNRPKRKYRHVRSHPSVVDPINYSTTKPRQ